MIKQILVFIVLLAFLMPSPLLAKSMPPKEQNISLTSNINKKKAVVVIHFQQLKDVIKTDYVLTYTSNNITQGAVGTVTANGKLQEKREIFLGTCSNNNCIKHNPKNMKLTLTTKYKSGKIITSQYSIK